MDWQTPEVATTVIEAPPSPRRWDPTYDHDIGLTEARELISRHKRAYPGQKSASVFTRLPLDAILAQVGCVGVRMYYGMNPDQTPCLILVGVDELGNDIDEGVIAEKSFLCPPFCSMDSMLDR